MRKYDKFIRGFRRSPLPIPDSSLPDRPTAGPAAQLVATISGSTMISLANRTSTGVPLNPALELAVQRYIDELPESEKESFRTVSESFSENEMLGKIREYDACHARSSSFRPQADRLLRFFGVLSRFMSGVAIGIRANPDISAIIIGAICAVINIAMQFLEFYGKLADMLCQFEDYLPPLAELANECGNSLLIQETLANTYADILEFCRRARATFIDSNGNPWRWTSFRQFIRQQWEPFEIDYGSIRTKMQHHIDVLRLAGQAQQLNNSREARLQRQRNGREQFLNWISALDFEIVHDSIYAKKHVDTGSWLIQTEEFQTWANSSKSALFWCCGKPGAGKSVLASNVLEHLTTKSSLDDGIAMCFVYYNYKMSESQDPPGIAAALIKQLCRKKDIIPLWLLKFKNDALSPALAGTALSIIRLVQEMNFREVYIIIDALDECQKHYRPRMIQLLNEVMNSIQCAKVFVTSRRESDIERAFTENSTPTIQIQIQARNVATDIRSYVESEVKRLRKGHCGSKLFLSSDALEARVISTLVEQADGMFLWVNLQLKSLCEISAARKDELVDQALYTLPNGLDETYTKIVNLIEEQPEYMKNLALKSLTWILFAKRPLRMDELQHALATDRAYQTKEKLDLDSGEAILEACNNLALMENGVVRPAHYSVQEFFTSPRSETFQGSLYQNLLDAGLVHQTLASVCIKYIRLGELVAPCKTKWELRDRIVNVAFAHYAAHHFDCHIQEARTLPPELIDLLGGLLERDEVSLASILQFRIIDRGKLQEAIHYDFSPFSFTVSPSLIVYATRLFEVDQIKARWLGETIPPYALHLASRAGVASAVERLLDLKVDIEKKDEDGMSPIYLAACCGHLEVVELLWRHSADVNAQGGYYGFALQASCAQGHEAVVDTLLAKGADVNAQGGYYGNALQGACSAGHETIVDGLLEKGANVNAQGGFYGNALQAAHSQGYKTIVEKLLAQGANADVQSG